MSLCQQKFGRTVICDTAWAGGCEIEAGRWFLILHVVDWNGGTWCSGQTHRVISSQCEHFQPGTDQSLPRPPGPLYVASMPCAKASLEMQGEH